MKSAKKTILFGVIPITALLVSVGLVVSKGILEATIKATEPNIGEQSSLVEGTVDPDVLGFVALAEQATRRARQVRPEATLRQIIIDVQTANFLYTDAAAIEEFVVEVPIGDESVRSDQLTVEMIEPAVARYVGGPALSVNLDNLRIGPDRVKEAITQHALGCNFSHSVLYPEGDMLTWVAFCATGDGLVSGRMDNQTGVFHLELLAPWPSVATPIP